MIKKICQNFLILCIMFFGVVFSLGSNIDAANVVSTEEQLKTEISNATDGEEKIIKIDTTIEVEGMIEIPASKNITLTSDGIASLVRNSAYIDHIIYVDINATLTLENIVIDGERETRKDIAGSLIYTKGQLNIHSGAILKNNEISIPTGYGVPSDPLSNYSSGGAVYATGDKAEVNVDGGLIDNNKSLTYRPSTSDATYIGGGGISAHLDAKTKVISGTISNNEATGHGGGIFSTSAVEISGGIVEGNIATLNGGGVAVQGKRNEVFASFTMTDGEFKANESKGAGNGGGGAIYLIQLNNYSPSMTVDEYTFIPVQISGGLIEGNIAKDHGGGIYYGYADIEVGENIVMKANTAGKYGGAISVSEIVFPSQRTDLTINGGIYTENVAGSGGGAIYVMSGKDLAPDGLIINGGEFTKNTGGIYGGAIYTSSQAHTYIKGTKENPVIISENKATTGGGVYARGNIWEEDSEEIIDYKLFMTNVIIKKNEANLNGRDAKWYGHGGGLAFIVELDNVVFTENTAEGRGTAISNDGNSYPYFNQIIASGNTQIGLNKNDNGAFLTTYGFTNDETGEIDYYRQIIELKGDIGEKAFYNVEGAQQNVVDNNKTVIENTIGRVIIEKQNKEAFTTDEFKKVCYTGPKLIDIINENEKSQIILAEKPVGTIEIVDDFGKEDGIVVIYRTGDTGETSKQFPDGYPSTYQLKLKIDDTDITAEQLKDVQWTVETAGNFSDSFTYAVIEDRKDEVLAKKSGVVKVTAVYNGSTSSIYVVVPGDVNRDSLVNGQDGQRVRNYNASGDITKLGPVDDFTLFLADMNGDSLINGTDSTIIRQMNSGELTPSN